MGFLLEKKGEFLEVTRNKVDNYPISSSASRTIWLKGKGAWGEELKSSEKRARPQGFC